MSRTIVVAVKDLLFGSKIHEASKRAQVPVQWASRFERLSDEARKKDAAVLVVDLMEAGVLDELAIVKQERPGTEVVGFLGHERTDLAEGARALGVTEIFTRGQFSAQAEKILTRVSATA